MNIVSYCLALSTVLFLIGMVGLLIRRNIIVVLMCIELMLNAVNLNFVAMGRSLDQMSGQIMAIFVITVAAAEAVVGLAILVALYRHKAEINVDTFNFMKW